MKASSHACPDFTLSLCTYSKFDKNFLCLKIGGIRFMFDNIVESIKHYETSRGFGCILAHSMGLGKTLQVISFIDVFLKHTGAKTVLCVVPVMTDAS